MQRFGEHSGELGGMCVPATDDDDGGSRGGGSGSTGDGSSTSGGDTLTTSASLTTANTSLTTTGMSGTTFVTTTDMTSGDTSGEDGGDSSGGMLDADLVLWMDFDDGDVADRSDYGHDVTCQGICPSIVAAAQGNAAQFVSSTGYLRAEAHPVFDLSDEFTLTMWVRVDDMHEGVKRGQLFVQDFDPPGSSSFDTTYDLSVQEFGSAIELPFAVVAGSGRAAQADQLGVQDNGWHFYSVLVEPGMQTVAIDGEISIQGALSPIEARVEPISIGGARAFGFPLLGAVDDVRLYRRILDPGELEAVMSGAQVR